MSTLKVTATIFGLLAVALMVGARPYGPRYIHSDLDEQETADAQALASSFGKLNKMLETELPDNTDAEQNLEATKKILANTKEGIGHRTFRKAMELVVSLEGTATDCSHESYSILAKNYLANDALDEDEETRTGAMLDHYRAKHRDSCLDSYIEQFNKLRGEAIDETDFQRIESIFKTFDAYDFDGYRKFDQRKSWHLFAKRDFTLLQLGKLTKKPYERATYLITETLLKTVEKQNPEEYETVKSYVDEKTGKRVLPEIPNKMFDDYLFNPCSRYEQTAGKLMEEARFTAANENIEFFSESGDEYKFTRAIIYHRMCKAVLAEQPKLYSVLNKVRREE